jgi:hypothetical protein
MLPLRGGLGLHVLQSDLGPQGGHGGVTATDWETRRVPVLIAPESVSGISSVIVELFNVPCEVVSRSRRGAGTK